MADTPNDGAGVLIIDAPSLNPLITPAPTEASNSPQNDPASTDKQTVKVHPRNRGTPTGPTTTTTTPTIDPPISISSQVRGGQRRAPPAPTQAQAQTQARSGITASPRVPATAVIAGGLVITEPPPGSSPPLYKIAPGGHITLGWKLTGVLVSPHALTFAAACDNGASYPVVGPTAQGGGGCGGGEGGGEGEEEGVAASATQLVWDVGAYQAGHPEHPLPGMANCTLMVWDEHGRNANPGKVGVMNPNLDALRFAVYTPEPYVGLDDVVPVLGNGGCGSAGVANLVWAVLVLVSGWSVVVRNSCEGSVL